MRPSCCITTTTTSSPSFCSVRLHFPLITVESGAEFWITRQHRPPTPRHRCWRAHFTPSPPHHEQCHTSSFSLQDIMAEPQIPQTLVDWLDDLCVRFLLNLPASELSSVPRLCFQVEEAQWFYEDFVRPAVQASGAQPLPHLPLRQFCLLLFHHCPLFSGFTDAQHLAAYEEFLAYKVRVPVRGAILMDQNMEKMVLVRGWKKGSSWSFPRGKINKDERDLDCAIREVYEETGYNLSASGLLPQNEDDLKYIDIVMREQHMRLFVVRGVPEDTYFETQTRKEIGKIEWFGIKDLPGFKKQSKQQQQQQNEGETAHANKFYMVAPFLGPLKKWIGQQRKQDIVETQRKASNRNGLHVAEQSLGTDYESEDHQIPQWQGVSVGQKEEELRRLLSVGTAPTVPQSQVQETHAGDLLAMLRGGLPSSNNGPDPHTPFEQISAFPPPPETPHPTHPRQPIWEPQRAPPPPQFPLSPQHVPQQQRDHPLPTPNIFGPGPGPSPLGGMPNQPPGLAPGMLPPHLQQQQHQHQHYHHHQQQQHPQHFVPQPQMPGFPPFGPSNGMPFNGLPRPPMPQVPLPVPQMHQQPPQNAFMAQGPQGPIANGPAVPNASQLPAPRLNQHTMRLLDVFKGGNSMSASASTLPSKASSSARASGTHQTALLDLFKKPAASTPPPSAPMQALSSPVINEAASHVPAGVEKPSRPAKLKERKPTWNEITRTLPPQPKARPPVTSQPEASSEPVATDVQRAASDHPQKSFAATNKASARSTPVPSEPHSPVRILQRPSSKQSSVSPQRQTVQESAPSPMPSARVGGLKENASQSSQFTILTRPGSSGNAHAPSPGAPASPLHKETPKSALAPHILKRHPTDEVERGSAAEKPTDKRDQLLALFGKPSTAASPSAAPPAQEQRHVAERKQSQPSARPQADLLGLLRAPSASSQAQPTPPPATVPISQPPLSLNVPDNGAMPERKQQNALLNLFTRSSNATVTSPTAPISPFTLGTPLTPTGGEEFGGGRIGSGSVTGGGPGKSTTPVQAKEFLMGYLNGVLKNEGYKGTGGQK